MERVKRMKKMGKIKKIDFIKWYYKFIKQLDNKETKEMFESVFNETDMHAFLNDDIFKNEYKIISHSFGRYGRNNYDYKLVEFRHKKYEVYENLNRVVRIDD